MRNRYSLYSHTAYFLILSAFLTSAVASPVFADDNKENMIKAAFIVNFLKFVEWPDVESINKQEKIDICVIGDSGIIKTSKIFSKISPAKFEFSLISEQNIRNISSHCHILFISESEESRLPDILSAIKEHPVLTISDGNNYIERGVMIGFTNDDNKIKLEVNKKATESSGIKIDSQLLEIALRVIDK